MLDQTFNDNSVLAWLIALAIALATAAALVVLRAQAVRWLTARAGGRHPRRVTVALAALQGTQPWFLIVVALFVGAQFVTLPPKADRLVDHVALIGTIVQAALWASRAIRGWLGHQVAATRETDAAAATTVSVLGFFVQLGLWSGRPAACAREPRLQHHRAPRGTGHRRHRRRSRRAERSRRRFCVDHDCARQTVRDR